MELPFDPRLLFALVTLFVLVTVAKIVFGKKSKGALSYPYVATDLFTKHEQAFLRVLEQAAGEYRVFGKVRVADVIGVREGLPRDEWRRAFNRTSQKHLDFVLCDPHDLSVWVVVELDDKTHARADRQERDKFLENALAAAKVPLVRIPSRRSYDVTELKALLNTQTILRAA